MGERKHLNSLGFVIGAKRGRPLIAWGYDDAGQRIGIDDAERGGAQGLRCECKASLVAKKGDIREHHFAHKAGDVRHCDMAAAAAVANFIADALLDAQEVDLPFTAGRVGHAEVLAVSSEVISGHKVHLVDAQKERRLMIFARVRRTDTSALSQWCVANDLSGMVIDLTACRNRTDEEIRAGVRSTAPRNWLLRRTSRDLEAGPGFLRRLYGLIR